MITFFKPESKYGPLSNMYYHRMKIDGNSYKNVTSYIYSNLLSNPEHKNNVMNNPEYDTFIRFYDMEYNKKLYEIIEQGVRARFGNSTELLKTGNAKIIYISSERDIGQNNGVGLNLYGKALEKIRAEVKNKFDISSADEYYEKLYNIYKINMFLEEKISKGENINNYNISFDDLIMMTRNMRFLDKEMFIKYQKSGEIQVPRIGSSVSDLITLIQKKLLRKQQTKNKNLKKRRIFSSYLDSKRMKREKLSKEHQEEFEKKFYSLFENKKLPSDLYEDIIEKTKNIHIYDEEEIKKAETFEIEYEPNDGFNQQQALNISIIKINNDVKNDFYFLNPLYKSKFYVEGFEFPNLAVFFAIKNYSNLIENNKIIGLENAYNILIRKSIDEISMLFSHKSIQLFIDRIKDLTRIALQYKFRDPKLLDLLLQTNGLRLRYDDRKDKYLGVGNDEKGFNITGGEMETIREEKARFSLQKTIIEEDVRYEDSIQYDVESNISEETKQVEQSEEEAEQVEQFEEETEQVRSEEAEHSEEVEKGNISSEEYSEKEEDRGYDYSSSSDEDF